MHLLIENLRYLFRDSFWNNPYPISSADNKRLCNNSTNERLKGEVQNFIFLFMSSKVKYIANTMLKYLSHSLKCVYVWISTCHANHYQHNTGARYWDTKQLFLNQFVT